MNIANAVGKRIQELLFQKKMSQYRLGKITCLNEKTIGDLIKGRTKDVNFSTLYLIVHALDMNLVEFFNSPLFNYENIDI